MKIHVGNLTPEINQVDLENAFAAYGQVTSVNIFNDNDTGSPQWYAIIEMPNQNEGIEAITNMNNQQINGYPITVTEATQPIKATTK